MSTHYALIGYLTVLMIKWMLLTAALYFGLCLALCVFHNARRWLIRRNLIP